MAITKVTSGLISADASSIDLNIDAGTLYLDVSENKVGIGTTSPSKTLHVNGEIQLENNLTLNENTPAMVIPNGDFRLFTGGSEKMRIDSGGRVMLGTSSNSGVSNNADNLIVGDNTSATEQGITLCSALASGIRWNDGTDAGLIEYIHSSNTMTFYTSGSERMRIDGSGNLLIGTTTVTSVSKLQLTSSNQHFGFVDRAQVSGTGTPAGFFNSAGSEVGRIGTTNTATSYNTSSDYRLKENVDYEFNALDRVAQLKPARFNFIADADTTVDGFLAHEVQDIVPEAVTGEKDGEEMQSMDYGRITPLLVKAIQEQQTIIDNLTTRIETLENA